MGCSLTSCSLTYVRLMHCSLTRFGLRPQAGRRGSRLVCGSPDVAGSY
ncbi:hypothetical protein ACIP9X_09995 [Arthrobacter sp. NPDC093125]